MGMGDEDMADPLAGFERVQQGFGMDWIARAGINQSQIAFTVEIGIRAPIGKGRGVGRDDAADAGGQGHGAVGARLHDMGFLFGVGLRYQ